MTQDSILQVIKARADALLADRERIIIAIDGRCASGKSTLSVALAQLLHAPVIHMDDFFLRPHMRTPERLAEPGGNVDKERFSVEVFPFLRAGRAFSYTPFDCHTCDFSAPVHISPSPVILVEGSYACCPEFRDSYDLHIFLTVDPAVQLQRIADRNGPSCVKMFKEKWIPLEECYFQAFDVEGHCELTFDTTYPPEY